MGGRGGSGGLGTQAQRRQVEKLTSRLQVGANGSPKFGGDSSKIIEAPTFSRNKDGTISYRLVGERIIPAQKSVTIGVGDTPERRKVTVSTGTIMKDGLIKANKNETTETVIQKERRRRKRT